MKHRPLLCSALGVVVLASCSDGSEAPESISRVDQALLNLESSNFEIDENANLRVDGTGIDWSTVAESRKADTPSGANDDAFGKGTKEDTAVPVVVTGGVPPNQSDLKSFGVYLEREGDNRYLHMYWLRVQDPSGTTNMDFEFNQGQSLSTNDVTPVRTSGDLLIQYDLAQGGTVPELYFSRWINGSEGAAGADCEANTQLPCWSKKTNLSQAGVATGSINTSPIPATEADGLGSISSRTFGEASIDFSAVVPNTGCISFGSAYLKSRSSDSFTAALKDYISSQPVSVSNCGTIKIIKVDDGKPAQPLSGAKFDLVVDAAPIGGAPDAGDTMVVASCTTENGECSFPKVVQGDYWVIETTPPVGHDLANPAWQHVSVTADETKEFQFVNPRQRGAIRIQKTKKHATCHPEKGDPPHGDVEFHVTPSSGEGSPLVGKTNASGELCFDNVPFGEYVVHEVEPFGYVGEGDKTVKVDSAANCDEPFTGELVQFVNMPLSNITVSFESQVEGATVAKISCADLLADPDDETPLNFDDVSETYYDLLPGTYTCTVVIDP